MVDEARHNRDLALRWYDEVWNQRRVETIDEVMSPDFVGRLEGRPVATFATFKEHYASFTRAMPDFRVKVQRAIAEGRHVAVRWRFMATHTGRGLGMPPTGKKVDALGLTWMHFEGGYLVGGWDSWNFGELIADLARLRIDEIREHHGLSPRQAEVALLMADRRTATEIASSLGIRPNTARRHCQDVLTRLHVNSRQQVVGVLASWRGANRGATRG